MKVFRFLATALCATAVAAAPLTTKRQARHEARRLARANSNGTANAVKHKTNPPLQPGSSKPNLNNTITITNSSHVEYSSNWAGAVLIGTGYTAVTAEFTVPTPSVPGGGSDDEEYCASAWVGIDGDTCDTAILQTGVDFCVEGDETAFSTLR